MKRLAIWGAVAIVGLVMAGAVVLSAFDLPSGATASDHVFLSDGQRMSGTLLLPQDVVTPPVALLVHGDGPQDRWSASGYLPLVGALINAGIGVFSWDKPGVGESAGDWLAQSMADRSGEAAAAFGFLRDTQGIAPERLGFLGFSQAGWVIPSAARQVDAAFVILIGPAVNWRRQGAYFTRRRLQAAGLSPAEVAGAVAGNLAGNDALFGAQGDCSTRADLSAARCGFVRRNYGADATAAGLAMTMPTLVMVGAEDLNVDAVETAEMFSRNPDHDVRRIAGATHSLLRAQDYGFQTPEDWTVAAQLRFLVAGRHAYAPGVLDQMTTWIVSQRR